MKTTTVDKVAAARSFVRSLDILLKFARLYGFGHARTATQFETAWQELRSAIPEGDETGLLLGASGAELLVNGAALKGVPAERSFAQLLSTAGIASIQFLPSTTHDDLARLIRAFPTGNKSSLGLVDQLKEAVAATRGIRLNEVRFVAEDGATSDIRSAAALTAKALGADAKQFKALLSDPQKLLQLIAAAEGSRGVSGPGAIGGTSSGTGGPGSGGTGTGSGYGSDSSGSGGTSAGVGTGGSSSGGPVAPALGARDEEILTVLRMLSRIGQTAGGAEGPGPFQQELSNLPHRSRSLLQDALATLAKQSPAAQASEPMLLRLAENLAIRFALDRYERGEVRVNAVREMLDRMSQEITGLRKILGAQEEKMVQAGMVVESQADALDRQFWAGVPESGKRAVLNSPEAWCVPPRNVRQYVQELQARGDDVTSTSILDCYSQAVNHEEAGVRRRVAIGLAELADLYAANQTAVLEPAIQRAGLQLSVERDAELQGLISAAFVRLAQEAIMGRHYHAVLQSLDSIDSVENQRPTFAQTIRPRLGIDQRLADFIEEAVRTSPGYTPSLIDVIGREAPAAALELVRRFNRSLHRAERERIVHVAAAVGPRLSGTLRETLQVGQPTEAADFAGLLMCLDPSAVEGSLASRLAGWSQIAQDRALRLVASSGAPARGRLLLSVFDQFDPMLQPLALDEMGMSGETSAIDLLLRIASGAPPREGRTFLRLKAAEALGRLRASQATGLLQEIVESKKLWQWQHPSELRLTAFLALRSIAPAWAAAFYAHSGFTEDDIHLGPRDSSPEQNWLRHRRHLRIRLKSVLPATATSGHETISLQVRSLSLSGGAASGEKHVTPGTLVALRLGTGLRPIRAQAFMRGARAQALTFEFADMDLEDRARLRRLLRENGPITSSAADPRSLP